MSIRNVLLRQYFNPLRLSRTVAYLPHFVRLFYALITDRRVPMLVKLVPLMGLVVALSPPNLELDFIPILGEADFLLIMFFSLKLFIWLCPPDAVREHVSRIAHRG